MFLAIDAFKPIVGDLQNDTCLLTVMLRLSSDKGLLIPDFKYSNTNSAQKNVVFDWPDFLGALCGGKKSSLQKQKFFTQLITSVLLCSHIPAENRPKSTSTFTSFKSCQCICLYCTWTPPQCCKCHWETLGFHCGSKKDHRGFGRHLGQGQTFVTKLFL